MGEAIITVENLSKAYRIGKEEKKADTLASAFINMLKAPVRNFRTLRNLRDINNEDKDLFWALQQINFEVKEGEVLGVIGHNGAGKSTLLKILSRITEPTNGRIVIRGRVSSLLEVGTGFHPDLTGRENIYMNGTILGMRKREIDAKLDEIIAFSGVARHIDTPVKRYSSGMTVRLAFSVAAHLEPEILIIDEVLAVGDVEFQNKCLGKMNEVAQTGRTVLFVSHNMAAVSALCTRGLLLKNGRIAFVGSPEETIENYLLRTKVEHTILESNGFVFEKYSIEHSGSFPQSGGTLIFKGRITGKCLDEVPYIILSINSLSGDRVLLLSSRLEKISIDSFSSGLEFSIHVKSLNLMPNRYNLSLRLLSIQGGKIAEWSNYFEFDVSENDRLAGLTLPAPKNRGIVYSESEWTVNTF